MRLIDVKNMEKQIKEAFYENPFLMGMLLRWVRKQPTIDAVPVVHGRWMNDGMGDMLTIWKCSLCGYRQQGAFMRYCPNCGARMDGDGNG